MNKKMKNELNDKMQVKLPDTLNAENILAELPEKEEKIVKIPKKKVTAKKIIPMVASFAVIIGLLGTYFGLGFNKEKEPEAQTGDNIEVMYYLSSYDKVYEKFDELYKAHKKDAFEVFQYGINGILDGAATDDAAVDTGTNIVEENAPAAGNSSLESNKDYGTTNSQEKGVEEGDIIKTDGNYLYVVNYNDIYGSRKSVSIVDVTGKEMKKVSEIHMGEDAIEEIYVNGDTLTILCRRFGEEEQNKVINGFFSSTEDMIYPYYGTNTVVKVYDVSNRAKPTLANEYEQQGVYNSSRIIDNTLYAISTFRVDISSGDYRDDCIPEIAINGKSEQIPAGCIKIIQETTYPMYTIITAYDIEKNDKPTCEAVLGNCQEIYASTKGLFICEPKNDTTNIYRFEYTDTGVNFKCMGKVDGFIHNQFSMSFDGEHFRVATQTWKEEIRKDGNNVSISNSYSATNLYILNDQMQPVGKVEDLAKGEQIKSVRFVGNMAYVVTFLQVDPLFVIDLTDPENPTVKGELKIPGFSQYLHPIAEGLLVGVGSNEGDNDRPNDAKVSLFDVTNPYEPTEKSVLYVDGQNKAYCYTQVGNYHKLYINLSETEFAVPFTAKKYVVSDTEGIKSGEYYIRYKLTGGELCEVSRYYLGNNLNILGATYVENTFYVLATELYAYESSKESGTHILAFDMTTNECIGKVQTAEIESNPTK